MNNRPIVIQGAMDIEVEYLKSKLENMEVLTIHDYKFYTGYINNSTEEYTDRLNGIEADDYYENYLKQNEQ